VLAVGSTKFEDLDDAADEIQLHVVQVKDLNLGQKFQSLKISKSLAVFAAFGYERCDDTEEQRRHDLTCQVFEACPH